MESGAFSYHRPYLQHLDGCRVMRLHEREGFGVGKRWPRQRRRMANLFRGEDRESRLAESGGLRDDSSLTKPRCLPGSCHRINATGSDASRVELVEKISGGG